MKRRAFTLVELLVVIAIIAMLISILVPVVGKARDRARKVGCASNLRQIGVAVKSYLSDHENVFPMVSDWTAFGVIAAVYLPYANNEADIFKCPAQGKYLPGVFGTSPQLLMTNTSWTSYEFNSFFAYSANSGYIRMLTSHDVLVASDCAYVYDYPYDPNGAYTSLIPHVGGMNVLYLDWHVAWLATADYNLSGPYAQSFYGLGHY